MNPIERETNGPNLITRGLYATGGIALVAYGLATVSLWRKALLLAAGASLLARAAGSRAPEQTGAASSRPTGDEKFGNGTRDRVDEASWESFPASDAPAY